jgi:hypothetical protein
MHVGFFMQGVKNQGEAAQMTQNKGGLKAL